MVRLRRKFMANIIHRRGEVPARQAPTFDPFRTMREMLRFDPFADLEIGVPSFREAFVPAFDIKETGDAYVFKSDLPGIKEDDLDVSLTGNQLVVSGKRDEESRQEEGDRYYAYERSYGSFSRTFSLPPGADLDHVKAELRDGVLTIAIGKRPETKAKKIPLQSGKPSGTPKA
jgi:HSP20 family protein